MKTKIIYLTLVLAAVVSIYGCGSLLAPQPDRTRFFVLAQYPGNSNAKPATIASGGKRLSVGVGPVHIPDYLQRPGIVTRLGPTRVEYSQINQWAEPLEQCFPSVLAQDLLSSPTIDRVVRYPWPRSTHVDYQIAIDVRRFELNAESQAVLEARWTIEDPQTGRVIESGVDMETRPAGAGAGAATAALSHALGLMAQSLVTRIDLLAERPVNREEKPSALSFQ